MALGSINHTADGLWKGKEWNNMIPVSPPRFTDRWIFLIPLFSEQFQLKRRLISRWSGVNHFQITGDLFSELVIDVFERIADHMDHTQLHLGVWKDRFNCLWKAGEAIHTGDKTILHATIGEFRANIEPEFGYCQLGNKAEQCVKITA